MEPAKLKLLAFTSERLHTWGDELFHEGDYGDAMYIFLDSKADILVDRPKGVIKLKTLARTSSADRVLCDVPRTATVVAHGDLETLRVPRMASSTWSRNFHRLASK